MEVNPTDITRRSWISAGKDRLLGYLSGMPLLAWLSGALVSVILERMAGTPIAHFVGLAKMPVLFGVLIMMKEPLMIPGALSYVLAIYVLPTVVMALVVACPANLLA